MINNQNQEKQNSKVVTPETQEWYINPAEKKINVKREDRLIWAVCYAPFGFIAPFITKRSSNFLSIHTKQGAIIFLTFLLLIILIPSKFGFNWVLFLAYLWVAWYPAYQAFSGHAFQYKFFNKILAKINSATSRKKK